MHGWLAAVLQNLGMGGSSEEAVVDTRYGTGAVLNSRTGTGAVLSTRTGTGVVLSTRTGTGRPPNEQ